MLSPAIITLPWRPDAAEHYFAPLSALPWAMLLHSGFADHPHNRFDILVAAPRATLLTRGEQTWVDDGETVVVSAEDPLQLLQQQLDRQPFTPQPHDDLPFLGGALGLFGYDLGRRFERLPSHAQADIALADMAVGIYDWALIVDHQRQQISLLSYDDPQQRLQWLEAQTPTPGETFALTSAWQSNMSRQQYGEKFRQVQAYLHSGDCYQVNSLALLRQASAPLVLIVVNNNGGQIFSMLPTPQDERRQFYLMPQDVDFSHAAAMFGLAYHRPDDWPSLDEALAGAWRRAGATVIELAVNETDGAQTLQQLLAQVSRL